MAEIIVPAVGLGLLWIISNQKKEGYETAFESFLKEAAEVKAEEKKEHKISIRSKVN